MALLCWLWPLNSWIIGWLYSIIPWSTESSFSWMSSLEKVCKQPAWLCIPFLWASTPEISWSSTLEMRLNLSRTTLHLHSDARRHPTYGSPGGWPHTGLVLFLTLLLATEFSFWFPIFDKIGYYWWSTVHELHAKKSTWVVYERFRAEKKKLCAPL